MRALHITGYDAASGSLVFQKSLPADAVILVRQIAGIPPADADFLGAYPLNAVRMAALAAYVADRPLPAHVNFFAETYEEAEANGQQAL